MESRSQLVHHIRRSDITTNNSVDWWLWLRRSLVRRPAYPRQQSTETSNDSAGQPVAKRGRHAGSASRSGNGAPVNATSVSPGPHGSFTSTGVDETRRVSITTEAVQRAELLERKLGVNLPLIWTFLRELEGWRFVNDSSWDVVGPSRRGGGDAEVARPIPQTQLPTLLVQNPEMLERYMKWQREARSASPALDESDDSDVEPTLSDTGSTAVPTKGDGAVHRKSPQLVPSGCFSTETSQLNSCTASSRRLEETNPNHSVSHSENRATNASEDMIFDDVFSEDLYGHDSSDQSTVSISSTWTSMTSMDISTAAASSALSTPRATAITGVAATLPATTITQPTTVAPVNTAAADSDTDTEDAHAVQDGARGRVEDQREGVDEMGAITPPPALRTRSRMSSATSLSTSDVYAAGGTGGYRGCGVARGRTGLLATRTGRKGRVRARVVADTNSRASLSTANEERRARTPKARGRHWSGRAAASSPATEVRRLRTPRTPAVTRSAGRASREISGVSTPVGVRRTRAGGECSNAGGLAGGAAVSARTAENRREAGRGRKRRTESSGGIVAAGVTPDAVGGGGGGDGESSRVKRRALTEGAEQEQPSNGRPRIKIEGENKTAAQGVSNNNNAEQWQRPGREGYFRPDYYNNGGIPEVDDEDPFAPYTRIERETVSDAGLEELLHNSRRNGYLDIRRYRTPGFPRPLRTTRIEANHGKRFHDHLQGLLKDGKRLEANIFLRQLEQFDRVPPDLIAASSGVACVPAWYQALAGGGVEVDEVFDLTAEDAEIIDCEKEPLDCVTLRIVKKEPGLEEEASGAGRGAGGGGRPVGGDRVAGGGGVFDARAVARRAGTVSSGAGAALIKQEI